MRTVLLNTLRYWLATLAVDTTEARLPAADLLGMIRSVETAAEWQDPEVWALAMELTLALESHMKRHGTWDEWDRFAAYMIARAHDRGDRRSEGELLLIQGFVGLSGRNRDASITCYRRAARIFRELHDDHQLAIAYSNLGYLTMSLGLYWRAGVLNRRAITLFELLGDTRLLGYTENHMGLAYIYQKRWVEAEPHLSRAQALMVEAGDDQGLAMVLQNLGVLCARTDRFAAAGEYYTQAREAYLRTGDPLKADTVLMDIGNVYRRQGNPVQAEAAYAEAEAAFQAVGDGTNLARVRHNLGMTYTLLENWVEAERCFRRALEHWRAEKDDLNLANTLGEITGLYTAWGQVAQARATLAEADSLIEGRDDGRARRLREELEGRREALRGRG